LTTCKQPIPSFARLDDGTPDGIRLDRLMGTYLHGAFEDPRVCSALFGIAIEAGLGKDAEHDALADWFERFAEEPEAWFG
jgi:cobyric acid synthase